MYWLSAARLHGLGIFYFPEYWSFLSSLQGAAKLRTGNQPETSNWKVSSPEALFGLSPTSSSQHQETWKTQGILILSFSPALIKL